MSKISLELPEQQALQEFLAYLEESIPNQVEYVALFGSKARGDSQQDSDIDVLVILSREDRELRREILKQAARFSLEFDVLLSPRVIGSERWEKMCGFSQCYRSEIGSYGKDTKGLMRVHEFFKFEQLILCEASHEESVKLHEEITENMEEFVESLGLPYRRFAICTGDLKSSQVKSYDTELWVPSMEGYKEIGSASYYHDFQTRRFNTKYDDGGIKKYVHSLNGTAAPTPRILISLIENYQQEDGSIKIPEVLQKYMGKDVIKS